jgi:hypothetical protein
MDSGLEASLSGRITSFQLRVGRRAHAHILGDFGTHLALGTGKRDFFDISGLAKEQLITFWVFRPLRVCVHPRRSLDWELGGSKDLCLLADFSSTFSYLSETERQTEREEGKREILEEAETDSHKREW